MSADRRYQLKIAWVAALACGLVAFASVFYVGYTNASAAGGIMPERCIYRIFCYTVSLPAVAFLRVVPLDSLISFLLAQVLDLSIYIGKVSRSAFVFIAVRSLVAGLFYTLLFGLGLRTVVHFLELKRREKIVWSKRCTYALVVVLGLVVALGLYLRKDVGAYRVCAYKLHLKGLPSSLNGLRLVFFSDLHAGTYSKQSDILRAADLINSLQPDILVGGGDYVFGSEDRFARAAAWMRLLKPRLAFIGVLGNHDYWHGSQQAEEACASGGLLLLNNEHIFIDENKKLCSEAPQRGLCLAGVGDLWSAPVDIEKALAGVGRDMPRLLFSHNPDIVFDRYKGEERIDYIVSGHTHGGQVLLPWGTPLGVSTGYPQQLTAGWYKNENWQIYINVGLGETVVPFRCGVRPEITLFVLDSGRFNGVEEIDKT